MVETIHKADFYFFSSKASDVARSAAFAGIALIWVFKVDSQPNPQLPKALVPAAALLAIGIGLDMLQYIVAALIWGVFHRYHEKRLKEPHDDPQVSHPFSYALPIHALFLLKLLAICFGYVLLLWYLIAAWAK